jgi:hypothetical protein
MSYTMEDFRRDYAKRQFAKLTPEEQREVLQGMPLDERLADVSAEEIRRYLDKLTARRTTEPRKPRRKR